MEAIDALKCNVYMSQVNILYISIQIPLHIQPQNILNRLLVIRKKSVEAKVGRLSLGSSWCTARIYLGAAPLAGVLAFPVIKCSAKMKETRVHPTCRKKAEVSIYGTHNTSCVR